MPANSSRPRIAPPVRWRPDPAIIDRAITFLSSLPRCPRTMFENLTDRLTHTLKRLRGQGRLSEENIQETLREVRMALLEADCRAAGGARVHRPCARPRRRPGSADQSHAWPSVGEIVHGELIAIMGEANDELESAHAAAGNYSDGRPAKAPVKPPARRNWRVGSKNGRKNLCWW